MTNDEYPYLAHLSVSDRLRIAAYEARDHGVPTFHLAVILDTAELLGRLIGWQGTLAVRFGSASCLRPSTSAYFILGSRFCVSRGFDL